MAILPFLGRTNSLLYAGQIELYTHHPLLPTLMSHLSRLGIRLCGVYLLDSQFMEDRYKYFRCVPFFKQQLPSDHMSSIAESCLPCPLWLTLVSRGLTLCPRWIWLAETRGTASRAGEMLPGRFSRNASSPPLMAHVLGSSTRTHS